MTRETYDVLDEPRGQTYRSLIAVARQQCAEFGLVHQRRSRSAGVIETLRTLKPHLVEINRERSWPGSEMAPGHSAEIYRFRLSEETAAYLASAVVGLYDWSQLERPEDLHFLRADGSLWLGSTSHEADAWFELETDEHAALVAAVPELKLRRRAAN